MLNRFPYSVQKICHLIILLLLCAGSPFFFLGGPGSQGARSFIALWDLGHVLFFFLFSWLLSIAFRGLCSGATTRFMMMSVFCTVFIVGIVVEGSQMCFDGRTPDIHDILRNQLGCVIYLFFFEAGRRELAGRVLMPLQILIISLALAAVYPLVAAAVDEFVAGKQFPVLADFETPFESDRWSEKEHISVSREVARHGKQSLRVELTTETYSGAGLQYFPGDWQDFKYLKMSVYYPGAGGLELSCRVHDSEHNNEYTDRFNETFLLENGWNDLVVSLADIQGAPSNRLMDMCAIENLKLFVVRQDEEQVIYIDYVYLE